MSTNGGRPNACKPCVAYTICLRTIPFRSTLSNVSANDVVLLRSMIENDRPSTRKTLNESGHEAYFVAKHYLAALEPSHEDLVDGIVDGSHDGGIDAIYIYADGFCIRDDAPLGALGKSPEIALVVFQVKNTKGFGETAVDKLRLATPELLAFDRDEQALSARYSTKVVEITRRYLEIVRTAKMPELRFYYVFASLQADATPHPNVATKGDLLKRELTDLFHSCEPQVAFLGASEICDYARAQAPVEKTMQLAESAVAGNFPGGYLTLVSIDEYKRFITDQQGRLDTALFEANVRDYEGEGEVNKGISDTLTETQPTTDFWWLNNGVTIVAEQMQLAGKMLKLRTPQVVNGLQTSHEVFKTPAGDADRSLLVKVIEAPSTDVRDRIIQATNSQTALAPSALRATDKVQRQIEEYLKGHGYYYERRKNYYANQGLPLEKVVTIERMSQAIAAVLLRLPHLSRSRPSDLFTEDHYQLLFNEAHPIGMYHGLMELSLGIEDFLKSIPETAVEIENYRYQMAMMGAIGLTRKREPKAPDVAGIRRPISRRVLGDMLQIIREEYGAHTRRTREALFDRLAKNADLTRRLEGRAQRYLSGSRPN